MLSNSEFRELANSSDHESLSQLIQIHSECFPTHAHVISELRENAALPLQRDKVVVHQVLARVDGEPAGIVVVHTNLKYHVGLIHFLAVVPKFRGREIDGKKVSTMLVEHAVDAVYRDSRDAGATCVGVVAESDPGLITSWESWGFHPLPIPYREPYFGKHWRDHLPLEFFDMTLVGSPAGSNESDADQGALARAGAAAFLLDHYQLPIDHDVVHAAISE